jgi:hypothetical protein
MPTKHPRIQVVLEKPLYATIKKKAGRDGISMSSEVRDIVKEWASQHPERPHKRYTGKYMSKLIGIYKGGKSDNLDDILAEQAHGIPD